MVTSGSQTEERSLETTIKTTGHKHKSVTGLINYSTSDVSSESDGDDEDSDFSLPPLPIYSGTVDHV